MCKASAPADVLSVVSAARRSAQGSQLTTPVYASDASFGECRARRARLAAWVRVPGGLLPSMVSITPVASSSVCGVLTPRADSAGLACVFRCCVCAGLHLSHDAARIRASAAPARVKHQSHRRRGHVAGTSSVCLHCCEPAEPFCKLLRTACLHAVSMPWFYCDVCCDTVKKVGSHSRTLAAHG